MGYAILVMTMVVYLIRPAEWIPALDFRWNMLLNAVGALFIIATFVNKGKEAKVDRTALFLICFFMAMLFSNAIRGQFYSIAEYGLGMLTNVLVYVLVQLTVTSPERMRRFLLLLIVLILFICFQCYLQYSVGENWGGLEPVYRKIRIEGLEGMETHLEPQVMWFGILNDPNDLGMLLIAFAPYMFYRATFSEQGLPANALWLVMLGIIVYITVLTNSRGSMLALIGAVGFFFILKKRSLKGLVLAGGAAMLILMVGPSRMAELSSGDASALERIYAWALALELFTMSPIVGVGADQFLEHHHKTTHNSYVLALAETGMSGFFFYTGMFATTLLTCIKMAFADDNKQRSLELIALACGLIGIMIAIFFISRTYVLLPFLYLSIVMTYARVSNPEGFSAAINEVKFKHLAIAAVGFIGLVYVMNRIATSMFMH